MYSMNRFTSSYFLLDSFYVALHHICQVASMSIVYQEHVVKQRQTEQITAETYIFIFGTEE